MKAGVRFKVFWCLCGLVVADSQDACRVESDRMEVSKVCSSTRAL